MHQENVVIYFDCADCFAELIDMSHVLEVEKAEGGESLYMVTDTGKSIATQLSDTLSPGIKEASYRSAIRHLSFRKRNASIDCYYNDLSNGKYLVHCEIIENGRKVLDINVEVDSKNEADRLENNIQ